MWTDQTKTQLILVTAAAAQDNKIGILISDKHALNENEPNKTSVEDSYVEKNSVDN